LERFGWGNSIGLSRGDELRCERRRQDQREYAEGDNYAGIAEDPAPAADAGSGAGRMAQSASENLCH